MKSLRIVLASLVLTVGIISLSSFITNADSKAFAQVCIEYKKNLGALTPQKIQTVANWLVPATGPIATICPNTSKLCAICFEINDFEGATDAEKRANALIAFASYVEDNGLPTDGASVDVTGTGVLVTVHLRDVE